MSRLSITRQLRIELRDAQAAFLWGPRKVGKAAIVSLDTRPRLLDGGIEVWPWQVFCNRLWAGDWM